MSGGSYNGINKSTIKSVSNRTVKSASVRKKEKLSGGILIELKKSTNPISTSDLCVKLDKAWHTIDRACLILQVDGKIDGFKIGNMNIWRLKE